MARLDRLGPAKEIAQIAAVIGRQFSPRCWRRCRRARGRARRGAARLVEAGLVFRRPGGRATYSFKHALVRDVAYESLLRAAASSSMSGSPGARRAAFPIWPRRSRSCSRTISPRRPAAPASTYRERAGDRAVARSAYAEAVAHFSRFEEAGKAGRGSGAGPARARSAPQIGTSLASSKVRRAPMWRMSTIAP